MLIPVNVGNPHEITIGQFAEEIIKLTGTDQKVIYKPLPTDDPKQRQPDITKAKAVLGWQPKVDRNEGLKMTWDVVLQSFVDTKVKYLIYTLTLHRVFFL